VSGAMTPAQTAEQIAATEGRGAYGKGGVNEFTGAADRVGQSSINENNAQAGAAGARAGESRASVEKIRAETSDIKAGAASGKEEMKMRGQAADQVREQIASLVAQGKSLRDPMTGALRPEAEKEFEQLQNRIQDLRTEEGRATKQRQADLDNLNRRAAARDAGLPYARTQADVDALPDGAKYVAANGAVAVKQAAGQVRDNSASSGRAAPAPSKPITQAEYARLPSGSAFTAPDGTRRVKP
jgi:chromosome segregation ATPase